MSYNTQLGELRSLVHAERHDFEAVCAALEALEGTAQSVGLAYAESHLEAWPDRVRAATINHDSLWVGTPWSSRQPLLRPLTDGLPPWWSLVRNLRAFCSEPPDPPEPGLQRLVGSPRYLAQITHLELGGNALTEEGARSIADSPHVGRLRHLGLGPDPETGHAYNSIGPGGFAALVRSPHLGSLAALDVSNNEIGDEGLRALPESALGELKELRLYENNIGDSGVASLAKAACLQRLERLELEYNLIQDEGALALARSPHLGQLSELSLDGNMIGDAGLQALKAAFANARLDLGNQDPW